MLLSFFFFLAANPTLGLGRDAERYFTVRGRLIGTGALAPSECLVSICARAEPLNDQFSAACRRRRPLSLEMKPQLVPYTHDGDDVLAKPPPKNWATHVGIHCMECTSL